MLILIAGATGTIGQCLVRSAIRRGHDVRALGRNPSKLQANLRDQLENFVEITSFSDNAGFERGCTGADAVIVAWNEDPRLALDAQLALLRAAEHAGIKRFHALSWNADWERLPLGAIESYDAMICFARQALLSSPIKPLYVFCGVLARTLFGAPGSGSLQGDSAMWIRRKDGERTINVVGAGATQAPFSTEEDVADFSVALVTSDYAEEGGYYRFCSDVFSIQDLKAVYERVRSAKCLLNHVLDVETCKQIIKQKREEAMKAKDLRIEFKNIVGLVYAVFHEEGTCSFEAVDAGKFADVPRTSLEDHIKANDWI